MSFAFKRGQGPRNPKLGPRISSPLGPKINKWLWVNVRISRAGNVPNQEFIAYLDAAFQLHGAARCRVADDCVFFAVHMRSHLMIFCSFSDSFVCTPSASSTVMTMDLFDRHDLLPEHRHHLSVTSSGRRPWTRRPSAGAGSAPASGGCSAACAFLTGIYFGGSCYKNI